MFALYEQEAQILIRNRASAMVVDFGTNQKGLCDFPLVINSNFGPILHRFWDMVT